MQHASLSRVQSQVPFVLSLKKHSVKLAVSDAIKLSGHKYPVDTHLIVLRKLEVVGRVGAVFFLYDQHRGLEWRFVILLADYACSVVGEVHHSAHRKYAHQFDKMLCHPRFPGLTRVLEQLFYRLCGRNGVFVYPRGSERVVHIANRNDAAVHAYLVAAELVRVARAIVAFVMVQYAIKNDGVYPGLILEIVMSTAHMRTDDGCFLLIERARGI